MGGAEWGWNEQIAQRLQNGPAIHTVEWRRPLGTCAELLLPLLSREARVMIKLEHKSALALFPLCNSNSTRGTGPAKAASRARAGKHRKAATASAMATYDVKSRLEALEQKVGELSMSINSWAVSALVVRLVHLLQEREGGSKKLAVGSQ